MVLLKTRFYVIVNSPSPPHVVSDLDPVSEAAISKSRTRHTVATIVVWLQSPITILSSAALD